MALPETLYKYQPFGPHMGLNLALLLKEKTLFFPRKHALNDPTDCEPNLVVPGSKSELIDGLSAIAATEGLFDDFRTEASRLSSCSCRL